MSDTPKGLAFPVSGSATSTHELEYMAYKGQHTAVYGWYKDASDRDRSACQSVAILNAVVRGGIAHFNKSKEAWEPAFGVISAIEHGINQFITYCTDLAIKPRQLYECILDWSSELADTSRTGDALHLLERAENLDIRIHPDLYARLIQKRTEILFSTGRLREAHEVLSVMAARYYLITDRNVIAAIFGLLGQTCLMIGEGRYFKNLLFENMRHAFTSTYMRRLFTGLLIQKIYERPFRALLDRDLSMFERLLFIIHALDYGVHKLRPGRMSRLGKITRVAPLILAYLLNTMMPQKRSLLRRAGSGERAGSQETGTRKAILVTRAMGGVGDLLMMTPGLHSLMKKHPNHEIHLAIPRHYKPLFAGNADIALLDIEKECIDIGSYANWYNFTDVPEALVESMTVPNVKKNRIEIFARAFGIRGRRLWNMDRRPRYFITGEERTFQRKFWEDRHLGGKTVIGVQLKSAEPYRDYPHMRELIMKLAAECHVILLHSEKTPLAAGGSIIDPGARPLRETVALAAACDAIIAPDSAFVHFAGALNIPCVALSGPIDGRIRTMDYPSCVYLDARVILQCVPCWRNEVIPCKLTNERSSACMENIAVDDVIVALKQMLKEMA
jgi:ADP-heptose:LPS heptosyltransferase